MHRAGVCEACGDGTVSGVRGVVPRFCPACYAQREATRKLGQEHKARTAAEERAFRLASPRNLVCQDCGTGFTSPNHAARCLICRALHKATAEAARDAARTLVAEAIAASRARVCEVCGTAFTSKQSIALVCSKECRAVARNETHPKRRSPRTFACRECGAEVTTVYRDKRRGFCSSSCSSRYGDREYGKTPAGKAAAHANHARRRARLKGSVRTERVIRTTIFERDGWRCQLCHRKVNPKLTWPDGGSATLDHIIPVSAGGAHEPVNLQLAHARCNTLRGTGGCVQLRLVG